VERVLFHLPQAIGTGWNSEFFVTVGEITLVVLKIFQFLLHRLPHCGERTVDANQGITFRSNLTLFCFQIADCFGQIDVGAAMIEMDTDVRITLRGFDYRCVERGAPDRVDALFRIDVVRCEMQIARFIVDHAATHRDGVPQHLTSDPDLLERMNPARRDCEIDRASPDNISFPRVGPALVKIDIVSAPT
jgi:hypothetical protein